MISKEQANNALSYLEAAAMHMSYESEEHRAYNIAMRQGSEKVLREFIKQADSGLDEPIREHLIETWIGTLRMRFGGLDFWRLSKRWKEIRYAEIATMIVNEMDWIMKNNPKFEKPKGS
jgi:hypothetical protein